MTFRKSRNSARDARARPDVAQLLHPRRRETDRDYGVRACTLQLVELLTTVYPRHIETEGDFGGVCACACTLQLGSWCTSVWNYPEHASLSLPSPPPPSGAVCISLSPPPPRTVCIASPPSPLFP